MHLRGVGGNFRSSKNPQFSPKMKKFYSLTLSLLVGVVVFGQIAFDPSIETDWITDEVKVGPSPLTTQVLFIGGHHQVQTTATYGNAAGTQLAKQWHDFIGFTPDNEAGTQDLGWVSVNHEMVVQDDKIGDGGGMTVFKIRRDPTTDSLVIVNQTLGDGRTGEFFNVDFANTVGETGMNCGGIMSIVDGRIWTAEEWFRTSNGSIADRDTGMFTIGTGTANYPNATSGFPGFNGQTVEKFQNYNYMVEIDPREAVAIRKQYNWGRQGFEGGCITPDNTTVYLGEDGTPGLFTKFVADTPGDFTSGTTYVYKQDVSGNPWIEVNNANLDTMLNIQVHSYSRGATMFNRIEWVVYNTDNDKIYFTETGRDNPGGRFSNGSAIGGTHAAHTMARATAQGTHPDSSDYADYYGRVMEYDPATDQLRVYIEGGPDLNDGVGISEYPETHLSNPDGLGMLYVNNKAYLIINEDLNGTSRGRVPAGVSNRTCELYLVDTDIANPTWDDLVRIAQVPLGAEVTGATGTPDGKTILFNSQHPSTSNPFPYNNSCTIAVTGWDRSTVSLEEPNKGEKGFNLYPNPTTRFVYFNEADDVAIYNAVGQLIKVYRDVKRIDVAHMDSGVYYVRNSAGETKKLVIQN